MLKAMICQPMAGLTKEKILVNRDKIVERLGSIEVIDTLFDDVPNVGGEDIGILLLAKSLEAMSKVDLVIFAEGWQQVRGCTIEHEVACAYNKPIIEF